MPSTPTSVLAALALTGALVGAGAATAASPTATSPAPETQQISAETRPEVREEPADRISIECGGYDADGNVMNEAATRIDHAPVDDAGIPRIPAVCGGYTAEGQFIGDD